jgi:hypothetical protein
MSRFTSGKLNHDWHGGTCSICGEDKEYYDTHFGNAEPSDKDLPVVATPTDNDESTTYPWNTNDSSGRQNNV